MNVLDEKRKEKKYIYEKKIKSFKYEDLHLFLDRNNGL